MLCFIIPLKSAKVSSSWELVSKLFERTIKSVCNQTIPDFRVIVICHERPNIEFEHPNVTYIEVDFPIPTFRSNTDMQSRDTDKHRKIWTGLVYAHQLNPSHIMFVDADDCVSRYLAEFISQNSQCNGWFIGRGYEYRDGSKFILHREKKFHKKCGTSHIIRYDLLESMLKELKFEQIKGWNFLYHQKIVDTMNKKGNPLELLPFKGAIKVIDNGENICDQEKILLEMFNSNPNKIILFYARRAYKSFTSRLITKSNREEFGLYEIW